MAQGSSAQPSEDPAGSSKRFILYGDSLAAHLYPGLVRVLGEDKIIQLTGGSRSALRVTKGRRCTDFYDWFVDDYVPNNKADGIIVSSRWLETYEKIGDEEFRVHLDALFEKLKDRRVIIYSQPASFSVDISRYIYKLGKLMGDRRSGVFGG
ncbi:SGNH hydrolase domain-containing protein [Candidatus Nitrospira nitrificans]|uniref:SGNH hydrolase domain-containing protein n=1 Tax=Candidatus Nitrospira nitrificans TaxID=1742973 RepID=UPI000A4323C0|nr:SGNH hydrolase domain-containing protein [Candidatus Nitrospira nitrificans]